MKKISLKNLDNLRIERMSKNDLKMITGGYTGCRDTEFQCGDGSCIPRDRVLDGVYDCPDRSDEAPGGGGCGDSCSGSCQFNGEVGYCYKVTGGGCKCATAN